MTALLAAALAYAARGIPVYPVHWPRATPNGAGLAWPAPAHVAPCVTGRPSIPWSAAASSRPPPTPTRPAVPVGPDMAGHPYGRRVLAALGRATPGRRNRTLNACAFKVYRYVGAGVLDDQEVTAAFTGCALAIGLQAAEVARTLASARTAGLANPRGVPLDPHSRRTR